MIAIADIFDALTAEDRPYKKAIPPQKSLDILEEECRAGNLDFELFRIFKEDKVYEKAKNLPAELSPASF